LCVSYVNAKVLQLSNFGFDALLTLSLCVRTQTFIHMPLIPTINEIMLLLLELWQTLFEVSFSQLLQMCLSKDRCYSVSLVADISKCRKLNIVTSN